MIRSATGSISPESSGPQRDQCLLTTYPERDGSPGIAGSITCERWVWMYPAAAASGPKENRSREAFPEVPQGVGRHPARSDWIPRHLALAAHRSRHGTSFADPTASAGVTARSYREARL
jgi:hypothetical protein